MRFQVVLLLLCLVVLAAVPLAHAASNVIEATAKIFDNIVLKSNVPVLVEFYAPWCGHCQRLVPIYEQVATGLKGIAPVVKVDATVEQALASKYGIRGYPTIKLFQPGKSGPEDYNGQRTASAMTEFVVNSLPNFAMTVTPQSVAKFWERSPAEVPRIILFTSKTSTPALFKAKAMEYSKKAVFGEIRQSSKELCEKYGVSTFPTLLFLASQDAEPVKFEGTVKPEAVSKWLQELLGGEAGSSGSSSNSTPSASTPPRVKINTVTAKTAWEPIANVNSALSCEASVCVVAVVEPGSDQETVLNDLVAKYGKQPVFGFRSAPAGSSVVTELATKLGTTLTAPTVVVINGKRSKFAASEGFDVKTVSLLLDRIIGGDAKWTKF